MIDSARLARASQSDYTGFPRATLLRSMSLFFEFEQAESHCEASHSCKHVRDGVLG